MMLHPAAPETLEERIAAYAETVQHVVDLGRGVRADEEGLPTDCPGWSVCDQVAHVLSGEQFVAGAPMPEVEVSGRDYLHNDFAVTIEKYLEPQRSRPLGAILDDLEGLLAERLAWLRDPGTTLETETVGPFGPTTVEGLLGIRTLDIWTHEQDLREALGRPGGLDTAAAVNFVARMMGGLPKVVARRVDLPLGTAVVMKVTGPVTAALGVRVVERAGTRLAMPIEVVPEGPVPVTISMPTRDFCRRAAGRRRVDELDFTVDGDEILARRVLDALAVTP